MMSKLVPVSLSVRTIFKITLKESVKWARLRCLGCMCGAPSLCVLFLFCFEEVKLY